MKKIVLSLAIVSMLFSCNKQEDTISTEGNLTENAARRGCYSDEHLKAQLASDPSLAKRMEEFELKSAEAIAQGRIVNGVLEIPVVVNVLYRTTAENISLAQIQSQIDVLNKDFNALAEDLIIAMERAGIPNRARNQLINKLAPMQRDIVVTP